MSPDRSYNGLSYTELKQFLEEKFNQYNSPFFISTDPISIPHRFTLLQDREISGFLSAAIAWGKRDLIIRSSIILLEAMDDAPYEFVMEAGENDLRRVERFVHRTFNGHDCLYFN